MQSAGCSCTPPAKVPRRAPMSFSGPGGEGGGRRKRKERQCLRCGSCTPGRVYPDSRLRARCSPAASSNSRASKGPSCDLMALHSLLRTGACPDVLKERLSCSRDLGSRPELSVRPLLRVAESERRAVRVVAFPLALHRVADWRRSWSSKARKVFLRMELCFIFVLLIATSPVIRAPPAGPAPHCRRPGLARTGGASCRVPTVFAA